MPSRSRTSLFASAYETLGSRVNENVPLSRSSNFETLEDLTKNGTRERVPVEA